MTRPPAGSAPTIAPPIRGLALIRSNFGWLMAPFAVQLRLSSPAKAGDPVRRGFAAPSLQLWILDRPVKPGDDGVRRHQRVRDAASRKPRPPHGDVRVGCFICTRACHTVAYRCREREAASKPCVSCSNKHPKPRRSIRKRRCGARRARHSESGFIRSLQWPKRPLAL